MADRLARLVKFRADQLGRARPDEMGNVAIPAITDPAEATKTAQQALRGFIAANSGDHPEAKKSMQALRDYLAGKADMPREWVLDETPMSTAGGLYRQRATEGRERLASGPFGAEALAVHDYFLEPLGRYAAKAVEVPVNAGIGILNWAGARIRPVDVRAEALARVRSLTGGGYDPRRAAAELEGMHTSGAKAARVVGDVADIAGMLRGFKIGGVAGLPATVPMKVGELAGRTLGAPVAKVVGKVAGKGAGQVAGDIAGGAGAFGAYEVVSEAARQGGRPTGEQALEAVEHGAVAGAAMSVAGQVARLALRKLFAEAATATKVAGEDGKILTAMKDWAKKNNVVPVPNQSVAAYGSKVIDSWVASGMQGAPPMAARRLIGRALEAGIESGGFSAIDVNFQHDFIDAIFKQDPAAFARMAETYGKNFMGVAASKMRIQDIPGFQRQQPTRQAKAAPAAETLAQEAQGRQRMEEDLQRARVAHRAEMDRITREANEQGMAEGDATNVALQEERARHRTEMEQITREANVRGQGQEAAAAAEAQRGKAEHRERMAQVGQEAEAQAERERQGAEQQREADARTQAEQGQRAQQGQDDLAAMFWRGYAEGDPATIAAMGDQAIGDLLRQGWQFRREAEIPAERAPGPEIKLETELPPTELRGQPAERMELPGTPFSFEFRRDEKGVSEGVVLPSQSLRELLSLPESMPAADFAQIINKAGVFKDLDATTLLPGVQISAAPPIYADGNVMRTIAIDGTVLESPLGPEPQWDTAKSVPARGGDVIGRQQQEFVDRLTRVLNTRNDWPQNDVTLLDKIITKLKTVSWQNDQAVADTLAHAEDLLVGIENGSPGHARRVLQAMAEMLTTKSPEVAIEDMGNEIARMEGEGGGQPQGKEPTRPELEPEPELQEPAQQPPPEGMPEAPPGWVWEQTGDKAYTLRQQRAGEAGHGQMFTDIAESAARGARIAEIAIRRVVRRMARMPLRTFAEVGSPVTDNKLSRGFALSAQERAREELPEPVANQFLQAETNTREYIDELSPLMEAIPGGRIRELEKRRWMEPTASGVVAGYELGHIAKETDLQQRFGFEPATLGERARAALEPWHKLTREIRRIASSLRMHVQGLWTPEGELAEIAPEAKKDVMTRQPMPELVDAMRRGPGNWLREAVVDALAHENNMAREDVERIFAEDSWTEARGLKRRDPVEHMRRFKYFPDHIKVPGHGTTRLLETQPLKHAKRMMYGAAGRMGTVKELGPDDPLPTDPAALLRQQQTTMPDDLPTPYRRIVESVPENAREAAATALRSLMGMQTNVLKRDMEVGGFAHKFWRLLGGLNDTEAASRMTFGSVIRNTAEAWATGSAMFGLGRITDAAMEVIPRIAAGEWRDMLRERQEAGGFAIHKGEWLLGGEEGKFDQAIRAMRTAGEALTLPLRAVQMVTDIIVHKALHRSVADWREGTHRSTDADALMTLFGFSREHAEQVVNGEAPPQAYRQIEMGGLARITRTGDLPVNRSDFARSRQGLAQAIKYTGYFQAQTAKLRKAVLNLREAETVAQQKTAAANLSKLLGFNMSNFLVGSSLVALASGGWDELMGFWSETAEDVQSPAGAAKLSTAALIGSFAGSIGSALSGGVNAMFTGNDRSKAEVLDTIYGAVPLIQSASDTWDFVNALGHTLAEKPVDEENQYSGKSPLQQIGYYLGREMPLAKWVESGPMGLGITFLGTDPKLENALKANRRIDNKLGIHPFFGKERDRKEDENEDSVDDRDLFVQTMRAAVTKLKASEEDVDVAEIADAIRDAMPDQDDKSIAASFLSRRVLSGPSWTKLSEEQQESKLRSLGADRVELLEGFDAVLSRAAAYFRPSSRRRRRR